MLKNYVLDTNLLLQNPQNIFGFQDNNVWILSTTLEELDSKKTAPGELGYNARESCRILDKLRKEGEILNGVKLENGGTLFLEPDGIDSKYLPKGFDLSIADNRIISSCLYLQNERKIGPVVLLSNDVAMRVKATVCGLESEEVRNDIVEDNSYTGHIDIDVAPEDINCIYEKGKIKSDTVIPSSIKTYENEFVTLHAGTQSALTILRRGELQVIKEQSLFGNVKPLNKMQTYAIYALLAPVDEIPLVILKGPAGTAKTFLALAAGLTQSNLGFRDSEDKYQKILISRPNAAAADPGFGFLPGDLGEKMAPLLASYTDNLEILLRGSKEENKGALYHSNNTRRTMAEESGQIQTQIDDLFESGAIELCPLNFIRGRSLQDSYIICDESQNANRNLIRDIVSRAGARSKVVITGDPSQVDVSNLDSRNNGLVYCAERMKDSPLAAIVQFDESNCVRSPLAEAAIRLMR